jgi:hypothetical protein
MLALQADAGHRPRQCEHLTGPAELNLAAGTSLRLPKGGALVVVYTDDRGAVSPPVTFVAAPFQSLVAQGGPLRVRIDPKTPDNAFDLCDRAGAPFVPRAGP